MTTTRRTFAGALAGAGLFAVSHGAAAIAQTPQPGGCGMAGTPGAMDHGMMEHATPMAGMHDIEFDQVYIDMMLPHHQSIIALAEVALTHLEDPRLKAMAHDIIETQSDEQAEMRRLREAWYGSAEPEPMTPDLMMRSMGHSMCDDSMHMDMDMDDMMNIMDPDWQVETFLAAADKDLAFIEQTIPHHQMAIDASEVALTEAVHPEIRTIARAVIDAQQAEIATLEEIRAGLTGEATPTA